MGNTITSRRVASRRPACFFCGNAAWTCRWTRGNGKLLGDDWVPEGWLSFSAVERAKGCDFPQRDASGVSIDEEKPRYGTSSLTRSAIWHVRIEESTGSNAFC